MVSKIARHVWDETFAEYNNPLPRWWMYLFWLTIFCDHLSGPVSGIRQQQGLYGWSSAHGENSQYAREMEKAGGNLWPDLRQVSRRRI